MLTKALVIVIATVAFTAACSKEPRQVVVSSSSIYGGSAVPAAIGACKHLKQSQKSPAVPGAGITAYEECLGKRANLTHPANSRLCALAKSVLSPAGICILGE